MDNLTDGSRLDDGGVGAAAVWWEKAHTQGGRLDGASLPPLQVFDAELYAPCTLQSPQSLQ